MKKFITQAFLATIPLMGLAGNPVPYYTDMGSTETKSIDQAWAVVNVVSGTNTWVYDATNDNTTAVTDAASGVIYKYDSKNDAADWLISPSIALKAGVEYKVSYWLKTASSAEDLDVFIATSSVPSELSTVNAS